MLDNYDAHLPYMETEAQEVKNSLGPCPVSYRVRVLSGGQGQGQGLGLEWSLLVSLWLNLMGWSQWDAEARSTPRPRPSPLGESPQQKQCLA